MAITQAMSTAAELQRISNGSYFDDAASPVTPSLFVGFEPRYVRVENETDRIAYEWFQGQASGAALQTVAAGTKTTIGSGGVTVPGNRTISFPVLQNKQYRYVVLG